MTYVGLAPRIKTAAADTTGNNTGNYTTQFTPQDLNVTVPWFELYGAVVENTPPGSVARIQLGTWPLSYAMFGTGGEWDPAQAKLLQPGQELFFYWNIATSVPGPAPRITLWLRYDVDRWGKT